MHKLRSLGRSSPPRSASDVGSQSAPIAARSSANSGNKAKQPKATFLLGRRSSGIPFLAGSSKDADPQNSARSGLEGLGLGRRGSLIVTDHHDDDIGYIQELRNLGHSAVDLHHLGVKATTMKLVGFSARELYAADYTHQQLVDADYSAEAIKLAGFGQPVSWTFGGCTWTSALCTQVRVCLAPNADGPPLAPVPAQPSACLLLASHSTPARCCVTQSGPVDDGRGPSDPLESRTSLATSFGAGGDLLTDASQDVADVWMGPTFDEWGRLLQGSTEIARFRHWSDAQTDAPTPRIEHENQQQLQQQLFTA